MDDLFNKLAAEEKQFFGNPFLCPVFRGQPVRVRVAGIALTLSVQPRTYQGWGVFQALDQKRAKFLREATMQEKREYLNLYDRFSVIITQQDNNRALGILANVDGRIRVQGQIPILLPTDARLFDTVDVRWDGVNFWFEGPSNRSPRIATALRTALTDDIEAEKLEVPGLTHQEYLAYQLAYLVEVEAKKDRKEERIRTALSRGGAVLRSYVERGDTYSIEYTVDGQNHHSVVQADTLRVVSAGICLSGGDAAFDLQSLVGVIRQGASRRAINRVGHYDYDNEYDEY